MIYKQFFILFCLASLSGCGDSVGTVDKYLASGNQFFEQENYIQARLEYKNALQIDDTLVDAYYRLALVDEKQKNFRGMFANLSQVTQLAPKHLDARIKMGELQLMAGQVDQVTQQLTEIFKISNENPKAFVLQGALLLKQQDFDGALAVIDKALAIDPAFIDAINLKAVIFRAQNDFPAAYNIIKQALAVQPNERLLHIFKLQLDIEQADNATIEADYLDLIKRFPKDTEFNFSLAKHYLSVGEQTKSIQLLQSVIKKNPDDIDAKLLLIDLLVKIDTAKAEEKLKQFITENEDEVGFNFRLADLYIKQKKLQQAKQPLQQIVTIRDDNDAGKVAKVLLAKLTLQGNDTAGAAALVKEVLALDAGYLDAMILKSRIELVNGSYDEAIADLRNIVRDFSASDEAMVLLAQAYLKKNAPELAEENFRKALDLNPGNFAAVMPVVSRMIKSKDITRAEEFLQKALELKPNHTGALQALAQVRLLKRDWLGTQQVADVIATKLKGNGFSKYLGGKISQGQDAYQEAADKYHLALVENPQLFDALKSMADCYNALNQREVMLSYLDEFIQKHPSNAYPIALKSEVYSMDKKWDEALAVLNTGLEKWPGDAGLYEGKARVYLNRKETQKVVQTYKEGLEKAPESMRLKMLLAAAYEVEHEYKNALETYEALIEKQPNAVVAVNNMVSLLLSHFPSKENTAKAVALAQQFSNSSQPYFLDTYGWALLQDGKTKRALSVFERLVVLKPGIAVFNYHLGLVYSRLNMNSKAVSVLEDALEFGADDIYFTDKVLATQLLSEVKEKVAAEATTTEKM